VALAGMRPGNPLGTGSELAYERTIDWWSGLCDGLQGFVWTDRGVITRHQPD